MTTTTQSLAQLEGLLADALKRLSQADADYAQASRRQTEARNSVNQLQKQIDEKLAEMRKGAPKETDWGKPPSIRLERD